MNIQLIEALQKIQTTGDAYTLMEAVDILEGGPGSGRRPGGASSAAAAHQGYKDSMRMKDKAINKSIQYQQAANKATDKGVKASHQKVADKYSKIAQSHHNKAMAHKKAMGL